jgi:hypothetical protein
MVEELGVDHFLVARGVVLGHGAPPFRIRVQCGSS